MLDIVGIGAKVISLGARLFGNMMSGPILLGMLMAGLIGATEGLIGTKLPLIAPLILYVQSILVSVIQAFVFPLLVAIFIKVATAEDEEGSSEAIEETA